MERITEPERRIMVHATAWHRGRYRNRYVAGPDQDVWPTLAGLVARGLMRVRIGADPDMSGMSVFEVTEAGMRALSSLGESALTVSAEETMAKGTMGMRQVNDLSDRLAMWEAHDVLVPGFFCRSDACLGDKGGGVFNADMTFNNAIRTECRCCGAPRPRSA